MTPLVQIECCDCGMLFQVPAPWQNNRQETKAHFFCPNGHRQSYTVSKSDRLARQLEQAQRDRNNALEAQLFAERQVASIKGQMTKLKKRIADGVCPCCKRSFGNLERHMCTEHPDYEKAKGA